MLTTTPVALTSGHPQPIPTIDDCASFAERLTAMLGQLAKQKYPLLVRRGTVLKAMRKGVEMMEDTPTSKVVKAGSKTYFFDVKKTKEGKPYLVITESRFQGEGKTRQRVRLTVFPEQANEFVQALTEIAAKLV
jgi:hypothetical protein